MKSDDKPTINLIKFMSLTFFKPPINWKGYKFFAE